MHEFYVFFCQNTISNYICSCFDRMNNRRLLKPSNDVKQTRSTTSNWTLLTNCMALSKRKTVYWQESKLVKVLDVLKTIRHL